MVHHSRRRRWHTYAHALIVCWLCKRHARIHMENSKTKWNPKTHTIHSIARTLNRMILNSQNKNNNFNKSGSLFDAVIFLNEISLPAYIGVKVKGHTRLRVTFMQTLFLFWSRRKRKLLAIASFEDWTILSMPFCAAYFRFYEISDCVRVINAFGSLQKKVRDKRMRRNCKLFIEFYRVVVNIREMCL